MKTTLSFAVALLFSITSYAQITLQNTVPSEKRIQFLKMENGNMKYYTFNNYVMKIYNSNHSVYKTITIDANTLGMDPNIDVSNLHIIAVSEKIFDNDTELEFMISGYDSSSNGRTVILNEDGSILFQETGKVPPFSDDDYEMVQNPWWIRNTENGIEMVLTSNSNEGANRESYVYSLPGTAVLSSTKIDIVDTIKLRAYPNPSTEYVNLKYNLPKAVKKGKVLIYTMNGEKIKEYNIDHHVSALKLSNSDISSGTYMYMVIAEGYKSNPLKVVIK